MKNILVLLLATSAALTAAPQPATKAAPGRSSMKPAQAQTNNLKPSPTSEIDQISETFGHMLAIQLKTTPLKLNVSLIIKGMQDELSGKPAPMSQEAYDKAVTTLQQRVLTEMATSNQTAAANFLKENSKKEGVVTLVQDKLQYKVLQPGTGAVVGPHDTPQIQYEGTLLDGRVFGSSYQTNEPVWLPLDQAIPGFAQGIAGMKEGEKRQLFIAPDLAYGENGTASIPPNSLLIFTVEVIKANKPAEAAAAPK